MQFVFKLVLLHLAVVVVLSQVLVIVIDAFQFFAQVLNIFTQLSHLELEPLVFQLLSLHLCPQLIALQL